MGGKKKNQLQDQQKQLQNMPSDSVPEPVDGKTAENCPLKDNTHWIAVRVVGEDDGKVIKDVSVKLKLTDGTERTVKLSDVTLKRDGSYRIDGLPAGVCDISLPETFDPEWKPQ